MQKATNTAHAINQKDSNEKHIDKRSMAGIFALCVYLLHRTEQRGGGSMFDFSEEKKEKYYQKVERILEEKELTCFGVDRERFGVQRNEVVKVFVTPFSKKTVSNHELALLKKIQGCTVVNNRYKRYKPGQNKPLFENAYFELQLEDVDK